MLDYRKELAKAVQHFWKIRENQKKRQGGKTGRKDAALPNIEVHVTEKKSRTLPGFYRHCKEWDLVVLSGGSVRVGE